MATCWINGAYVLESDAHVSIFDRGLLFGDGVYEVAAVFNGKLLDADMHLARLERSLAAISIPSPMTAAAWIEIMQSLAAQNGVQEGLVYLQVTRGVAERDFAFPAVVKPTCFAYARKKTLANDPHAAGIVLHAVPDIRWLRRDIKSVAMLAQVLAKQEAKAAGAFEAIMHEHGVVTEGGSSNVWIVQDGVLRTRPLSHSILAGITRDATREIVAAAGLPMLERAFTMEEALEASECFITSATSFILPVIRIDDTIIGTGAPGPLTMQLRAAYIARAQALTSGQ